MRFRMPSHFKEDLAFAFLAAIAIAIVMAL